MVHQFFYILHAKNLRSISDYEKILRKTATTHYNQSTVSNIIYVLRICATKHGRNRKVNTANCYIHHHILKGI